MWLLNNATPFAAERTWVRDQNGAEVWLVAVKGSFIIRQDGQQFLDPNQSEICRVPQFKGDELCSSLLYESDLVHKKISTDITLHGHAYSPKGQLKDRVDVRLRVANVEKTLRVYGDRTWKVGLLGLVLTRPKPFSRMPITYERTFGGTDQKAKNSKHHKWEPCNPIGTGLASRKKHLIGELAPNIEYPNKPYRNFKQGKPAGFGPIARHWSPRVQMAGTYDDGWEKTRSPLLPLDFDERFYQCAPEDQQVPGFLKGGEIVEVYNLTPEGYLSFQLPRVTLGMTTRFYDGTEVSHRIHFHSLIIQPDERRFQIVWHSKLPCHNKVNQLQGTTIVLKTRLHGSHGNLKAGVWTGE